ncbi:hypothetical protein Pcinc_024776 [Petrolisthes cinctipes]|uniref:Uncharacterized protein n=1 Tax=Petrolisthes cinctipes TaxID=88211 RepID=A0AAE1FBY8_PETCI|nr:hypothetical protein Pcinc_024776 [Petrolisthes cinctipes]
MHGCKVTSSISLLDRKAVLESTTWSMLAYPVTTDLVTKVRQYRAVAVWHFQDQNHMGMISAILSEVIDNNEIPHTGPVSPVEDKEVLHMEGRIIWIYADFGIIKSRNKENEPVFLYFKKSLLYINGELWNDDVSLHEISAKQQCKVTAKSIPEKDLFGFPISMKATLAWFGVKPRNVQHESFDIKAQESKSPVVNVTCMVKESTAESIDPFSVLHAAHGVIIGIVLMTDDDQGLILSNRNIVAFACTRFYINGEKFRHNYSSLSAYCSGRQVNVRAMVVPQQKAKVIFGCKVICEAICVWIGEEPNNLKNLETEYSKQQLKETATHNPEKFPPTPGYFYMLGKIIKVSDKMGILSCPTPEGYVNVTFNGNSFFKNGTRLPSGNKLDKNFSLLDYSCLVYPVTPKKYYGQTVSFSAIAVWKSIDCHKKSGELLELLASEIHKLCKDISNGKLSKTAPDLSLAEMSTAIQEIERDKLRNGTTPTLTSRDVMSWMTEEAKEIVKEPGNSSSTKESEIDQEILDQIPTENTKNQENLVEPTQEFYGKHMTAYVIQKCEDGGIAQWNSHQLMGYVHIKFSCRIMNVDLRPMSKNFKVTNVQNRSCNFFVRPIPHRTICGYTVSLQATCGWIGKKPANIPKPGTQELANLSLNEVHVMPLYDLPHVNYEELPSYLREVQELPLVPATQNIKLKQNVHTNGNHNVVVTSPPVTPSTTESSSCDGIWAQRNKREGHHLGTITEVFASMGQLKGEDGKQHFFTKDLCYLYGVVLRNVELWHVLVQGDKVLYTTYESKPGSSKVDCVWLGAVKVDGVQKTALLIHEWCKKNHIPDGAREILINQLDVS